MDRIGIIMHGVTGRMGYNQHLVRSILAIRDQGGIELPSGKRLQVDPIIVGRNAEKMEALAKKHGIERWGTDLDAALANPDDTIFFDAGTTLMRAELLVEGARRRQAHLQREADLRRPRRRRRRWRRRRAAPASSMASCRTSCSSPACRSSRILRDSGFFGRMLSVRCEFGYWVFEGDWGVDPQRPSWNYRKGDGGGIILDMLCHWRYVIDGLFGEVKSVSCLGATHIPERIDEKGKPYKCDADDAAYATFELENGVIAQFNSSWTVRVRRDDLVTFQVDGTHGSAVAGLTKCWTQHRVNTPKPVWNPDQPQTMNFYDQWEEVPDTATYDNGFKAQWEMFLAHVAEDGPWPYGLEAGAKGVQLAELGLKSWAERRWLDVPALEY